jgi:ketosteroid isomerase-like protein
MDRAGFEGWLRRYFEAWVSNDPGDVEALFAEDALYWVGPFREPWVGRDQIGFW